MQTLDCYLKTDVSLSHMLALNANWFVSSGRDVERERERVGAAEGVELPGI